MVNLPTSSTSHFINLPLHQFSLCQHLELLAVLCWTYAHNCWIAPTLFICMINVKSFYLQQTCVFSLSIVPVMCCCNLSVELSRTFLSLLFKFLDKVGIDEVGINLTHYCLEICKLGCNGLSVFVCENDSFTLRPRRSRCRQITWQSMCKLRLDCDAMFKDELY